MSRLRLSLLAIAVLLLPARATALTAKQARTMPIAELARELLGEAGALMVDVDRPRFDGILEDVRFYGRATDVGPGMCGSDWVTVRFGERGKVVGISAQRHYGIIGDLYPHPGKVDNDRLPKDCASVRSTKMYFPAPDGAEHAIAQYVEAIAGHGPFGRQSFNYSCTGACQGKRGDLVWLKLEQIDSSRSIDCLPSKLQQPRCFELTVGEKKAGPFPKKFRIYGTAFGNRVIVSTVLVDVGSTLE